MTEGGVVSRGGYSFALQEDFTRAAAAAAADETLAASADQRNENKTEKKKKIVAPSRSLLHRHQLSKLGRCRKRDPSVGNADDDDERRLVRALALVLLTTLSIFPLHVGLFCTARYLAHSSCLLLSR